MCKCEGADGHGLGEHVQKRKLVQKYFLCKAKMDSEDQQLDAKGTKSFEVSWSCMSGQQCVRGDIWNGGGGGGRPAHSCVYESCVVVRPLVSHCLRQYYALPCWVDCRSVSNQ